MTEYWQLGSWKLAIASSFFLCGAFANFPGGAFAQITPDTTLGNENSTVTSTDAVDQINGGATRGTNLFHSFEEFNVGEGRAAVFSNPSGIENILTRVTGANPSNILGTLGVAGGTANLFLLNPNGIIFGSNARLDVGGSFVGTTAWALGLSNGDIFSANPAQPLPNRLLNVNPNALLFNQIQTQAIVNRSKASFNRSRASFTGLQVPQGRSLLLVGGDVRLNGGSLQALGGRIELGGLAAQGTIGLSVDNSNLRLSFPESVARADVSLTNAAEVDVAANDGGNITITARNINITDFDELLSGIQPNGGFPGAQAGDIELHSSGAVTLADNGFIRNTVEAGAVGKGGNINITADSLSVTDGSQITNSTVRQSNLLGRLTQGNVGSININVRNNVYLDVVDSFFLTGIFSSVGDRAIGNGGDINITTGSLLVKNGAVLDASSEGKGDAGNVNIIARDTISFDGYRGSNSSGALSTLTSFGTGKGGDINITTGSLFLTNGAELLVFTSGEGDAGSVNINARDTVSFDGVGSISSSAAYSTVDDGATGKGGDINITTGSLFVTNGAELVASTFERGDAGSLNINARDTVFFDGISSMGRSSAAYSTVEAEAIGNGGDINITTKSLWVTKGAQLVASTFGQGDAGSVNINARDTVRFDRVSSNGRSSGAYSTVEKGAVGNGGGINITTALLALTNGGRLTTNSKGKGAAGNIEVRVSSIRLDNQAFLSYDSIAGQGNIFLRSKDLVLHRSSSITTNATGIAEGGNITIDTGVLAALENSDIRANAEEAFGGQVIIEAQGIFGTQLREAETSESDITATSRLGAEFNGTVDINTPDIDPCQGLVNLPTVPVDTSVAQTCTPGSSQSKSEFVVTGRGGLPPSPTEALSSDAIQVDWVTLNPYVENRSIPAISTNPTAPAPIVEAQGWVIDNNGEIVLTASASTATPNQSWQTPANCHATRNSS